MFFLFHSLDTLLQYDNPVRFVSYRPRLHISQLDSKADSHKRYHEEICPDYRLVEKLQWVWLGT